MEQVFNEVLIHNNLKLGNGGVLPINSSYLITDVTLSVNSNLYLIII